MQQRTITLKNLFFKETDKSKLSTKELHNEIDGAANRLLQSSQISSSPSLRDSNSSNPDLKDRRKTTVGSRSDFLRRSSSIYDPKSDLSELTSCFLALQVKNEKLPDELTKQTLMTILRKYPATLNAWSVYPGVLEKLIENDADGSWKEFYSEQVNSEDKDNGFILNIKAYEEKSSLPVNMRVFQSILLTITSHADEDTKVQIQEHISDLNAVVQNYEELRKIQSEILTLPTILDNLKKQTKSVSFEEMQAAALVNIKHIYEVEKILKPHCHYLVNELSKKMATLGDDASVLKTQATDYLLQLQNEIDNKSEADISLELVAAVEATKQMIEAAHTLTKVQAMIAKYENTLSSASNRLKDQQKALLIQIEKTSGTLAQTIEQTIKQAKSARLSEYLKKLQNALDAVGSELPHRELPYKKQSFIFHKGQKLFPKKVFKKGLTGSGSFTDLTKLEKDSSSEVENRNEKSSNCK